MMQPWLFGKMLKHGATRGCKTTPEYRLWANIKTRCTNPSASNYAWYGGRGITMCAQWFDSFEAFFSDVGYRPSRKHVLDRIDNELGYEPGNVRWVTRKLNARNTRMNVYIKHNGEQRCIADWAERLGISPYTIYARLKNGWSEKEALQARKRTPKRIELTFDGRTMLASAWARELGILPITIYRRIRKGWPVEKVLSILDQRNGALVTR